MPLSDAVVSRLAGLELNALNFSGVMPEALDRAQIRTAGTVVYDINGEPLFRRLPLSRSRLSVGYADVAINESLGGPLLATSIGQAWNERAILAEARAAAERMYRSPKFDKIRFVAYSFPKIALQFLKGETEVLMLEWKSWAAVPPLTRRERAPMGPSHFERWSLLEEMPAETRRINTERVAERLAAWDTLPAGFDASLIAREQFALTKVVIQLAETRKIRYSPHPNDHEPCYGLRAQQTPVWCVPASVEMVLDFYRYGYDQIRLAKELDQGTCADPHPLYDPNKVVTVIENLTSKSIDVTLHSSPTWSIYHDEIVANRPLISFIWGHSRTVAGFTRSLIYLPGHLPFSGLLVYDPWPPGPAAPGQCSSPDNGGTITQWENFHTQNYMYAFSSVLHQV